MGKNILRSRSDCLKGSVGGKEHSVCVEIIHRSKLFPLEDAPKSLSNIKMWAIRREKERIPLIYITSITLLILSAKLHLLNPLQ